MGAVTDMLVLENSDVRLAIAPELGGKIVSLIRKASGREFLLARDPSEPQTTSRPGDRYGVNASWGFDECVPTIDPCTYPNAPFQGAQMPDHGDLWAQAWDVVDLTPHSVLLGVEGVALPYRFERRVTIDGSAATIAYRIQNRSNAAFAFSWAAHPLLAAEEGSRIFSVSEQLAFEPFRTDGPRFSKMSFLPRLSLGEHCFGVTWPSTNELLFFTFDGAAIPYLGVWITEGGWPPERERGQYAIALEPCFAPCSLSDAIALGIAPVLRPSGELAWSQRVDVGVPPL